MMLTTDFTHKYSINININEQALRDNFIFLNKLAHNCSEKAASPFFKHQIMAIIKADAYGHGLINSAKILRQEGASCFGVGSVLEGAKLAQFLGLGLEPSVNSAEIKPAEIRIVSLLGVRNLNEAELCLKYGIIPMLSSIFELVLMLEALLQNPKQSSSLFPIAIKINTGMSRLGFNSNNIAKLITLLSQQNKLKPVLIASHLANADELSPADLAKTKKQAEQLLVLASIFKSHWADISLSLCNSGALFNYNELFAGLDFDLPQLFRPGLALYGVNPFYGTKKEALGSELKPVMGLTAPVLAVQELQAGDEVSYGGTFVAPKKMRIAVLGIGYSNGLLRSLANYNLAKAENASDYAYCYLHGHKAKFLGRICMQMCMVDISELPLNMVKPADLAYLLASNNKFSLKAEELAKWCDTIPYEILCALGKNSFYSNF